MRKNISKNQTIPKKKTASKQKSNLQAKTSLAPVAKGSVIRNSEPRYHTAGPGRVVVEKTEYITEVFGQGSGPFAIASAFSLNIGNAALFPWASQMSGLFESYVFRSLVFHYRTEAPTSQQGYVGLVVDYNPIDPPPATKVAAMDFEESVRGPPWQDFSHVCGQKNLNKRKTYFSRGQDETTVADPGLYDVGTAYVISGSTATDQVLGELWVTYVVEFITPELETVANQFDSEVQYVVGQSSSIVKDASIVAGPFNVDPFSDNTTTATAYDFGNQAQASVLRSRDIPVFQTAPDIIPPGPFFVAGDRQTYTSPPSSGNPLSATVLLPNSTYVAEFVLGFVSGYSLINGTPSYTFSVGDDTNITLDWQVNAASGGASFGATVKTGAVYSYVGLLITIPALVVTAGTILWRSNWFVRKRGEATDLIPTSSTPRALPTLFDLMKRASISTAHYRQFSSGFHSVPPVRTAQDKINSTMPVVMSGDDEHIVHDTGHGRIFLEGEALPPCHSIFDCGSVERAFDGCRCIKCSEFIRRTRC